MSFPSSSFTPTGSMAVASGSSSQNLLLDSEIRDWVVLPLLVIMIVAGLLRHYIGIILKAQTSTLGIVEMRSKSILQRSSRLRSGGAGFLTASKWHSRRKYFCDKESGYLRNEAIWAEETNAAEKEKNSGLDAMNPMSMLDGMKGNMAFMVQNMVMMQGISHFFKGFVLVKVPFPLTNGFKMMVQRGLDLRTLDTSYVSSVSWYFLVMFGLRAFFRLAIGDLSQETQEGILVQQGFGVSNGPKPPPPQQFNAPKTLRGEADNLEMVKRVGVIDDVERRLLGKKYPKKKIHSNPNDDIFGFNGGIKKQKKR